MTANARDPQGAAAQGAPPSGLTPPSPAATAEYSAEEISRLASIRERLVMARTLQSAPAVGDDGRLAYGNYAGDVAWLLARLDAHRESTTIAASEESRGGGLTPDVERVVRAAGRLSPGVWRQLGKWLRTREGLAGPWDPDDPPVLAQIANEVDEIADALAALRVAPPHES